MTAVGLNAVYKVLYHSFTNFITKKVIIHEDMPHGFSFQKLRNKNSRFILRLKDSQDCRLEEGTAVNDDWKNPVPTSPEINK